MQEQECIIYRQFPIEAGIRVQMNVAAFLWLRIQGIKYIFYQEVICCNSDPIHHPPKSIRKQMKLSK
jgi:hypothetical protein